MKSAMSLSLSLIALAGAMTTLIGAVARYLSHLLVLRGLRLVVCSSAALENRIRGGLANRWSRDGHRFSGTQTFHAQGNQFGGTLLFCFSLAGVEATIISDFLFFLEKVRFSFEVLGRRGVISESVCA